MTPYADTAGYRTLGHWDAVKIQFAQLSTILDRFERLQSGLLSYEQNSPIPYIQQHRHTTKLITPTARQRPLE
jgi:hypothetical protein